MKHHKCVMLNEVSLYSLGGRKPVEVSFLPLAFLWHLTYTDIQYHFISVYPASPQDGKFCGIKDLSITCPASNTYPG